jgi:aspartyl-tRNA(Asn)/glutamyl-tRNA(Gln) amidotransferase subunit B
VSGWEGVIGLEVHVQLKTKSKVFCSCPTDFGAEPNSRICPVCCGYPGVLPVVNRRAVEGLLRAALALGCRINQESGFARKQYFYPDLPKNYQISQSDRPLAEEGHLDILSDGKEKRVRIQRIHLEEDAGKLLHAVGNRELDYSLVDLNRTGQPLMEIVSQPDLRSPEEAADYLTRLRSALRYVGVSDCDMEKGSLRCDANVSVRPAGTEAFGVRSEVKNMNSIRSVRDAVTHEIARQIALIEGGGRVVQETRLWDAIKGETRPMRSKEEAHDYRYFPDPDLPPLRISDELLADLRRDLPELPEARRGRFEKDLGLTPYDAGVLTAEKPLADYYEAGLACFDAATRPATAKPLANWLTTELLGRLNASKRTIAESPVTARNLADLVKLIQAGTISGKAAKMVFEEMFAQGGEPEAIVKARGLVQVDDENQISQWVEEVIAANAKIVADIQGGKDGAVGSLVGQVMQRSAGKANPRTADRLLREKINKLIN